MVKVVERIQNSEQILIKKIAAETAQLIKEQNAQIISLSQGVPNLPIFDKAYEAMKAMLDTKRFPYTDVPGTMETRKVAADFINHFYQMKNKMRVPFQFNASHIIITAGAVQSVYNVLALSIENRNDIVLSPLPAYGLYRHQTELLGGTFVAIETNIHNKFVPTVKDLRDAFERHIVTVNGKRTLNVRSLILCYPNNPTGSSLDGSQVKEIADLLNEMIEQFPDPGFSVILDEVYLGISGEFSLKNYTSIIHCASERLLSNCFLVLSASKGLGAMPGMRAGFCACPNLQLVQYMIKVQMACSANASILSQEGLRASLSYILENPLVLRDVASHYRERTDYVVQRLNKMGQNFPSASNKIVAKKPDSTFYVFADFSGLGDHVSSDMDIQQIFRDMYKTGSRKIGVACVPGIAFGMDSKQKLIRFSCAVSMQELELAMDVIEEAIQMILTEASQESINPSI
jgi:aspartate/methionine/tyrosine aminotransferase